jgi:hypothetical protein
MSHALRRVFSRRRVRRLLWLFVIVVSAIGVNLIGIRIMGDVVGWSRWMQSHSGYFLAWRLCLYVATACGWWWMRQRVLHRESTAHARVRLRRTEVAAVLAILALEVTVSLR